MKAMPNVLLVTNKIPQYRLGLFNALSNYVKLTVAHCGSSIGIQEFGEIILSARKMMFFIKFIGLPDASKYDVIIVYANIRLLNLYKYLYGNKSKTKIILFGIGVAGSYTKHYDSDKLTSLVMKRLLHKADAAIFYDSYPTIKYAGQGLLPSKLFAASNTVIGNPDRKSPSTSNSTILFIGTLYNEKGIFTLLNAYKLCVDADINFPKLEIIGDGADKPNIESWIVSNKLINQIRLLGAITNENELRNHFSTAHFCISPNQAGLSVLKSFSYGVPYITCHYPISGGEFTAIIDYVTGFYFDGTENGLANKMQEVLAYPNINNIRENCFEFYWRFRSPEGWVNSMVRAINYTLNNNNSN